MNFQSQLTESHQKKIKRIVCSGGGARGAFYPGAYKAMRDTGLINEVETFAGASAGAITASIMALNMPLHLLKTMQAGINFKNLLGSKVGKVFKNPHGISFFTKDGKPLEQFLRKHILESVRYSLNQLTSSQDPSALPADLQKLIDKINADNARITFGDLASLHHFFPNYFKKLVISAVKFPTGEIQIFDPILTPDVEIAVACRASSSIPILLAPVEIEIDGAKKIFVDSAIYDNLPTDYFDRDEHGKFVKNKLPEHTLVFAFGEAYGQKDPLAQALYGPQWDQVITEEHCAKILFAAASQIDMRDMSPAVEARLLIQAINQVIQLEVTNKTMSRNEARIMMNAMKQALQSLLLHPHHYESFWDACQGKDQKAQLKLLAVFVKEKMKPVLSEYGILDRFKYDFLLGALGDVKPPYTYTQQRELGYQKLRTEYPLRTVVLRVGDLEASDFEEATHLSRTLDAFGYLDTLTHIINHDLQDEAVFNSRCFYYNLMNNFESIYRAVLIGCRSNLSHDPLIKAMDLLKTQLTSKGKSVEVISRELYYLVKDQAENALDGVVAFALSRAVEFHNKMITAEELFKEAYEEGFRRSKFFSVSNVTGTRIFSAKTLHKSLKNKNLLKLHKNQKPNSRKKRRDIIFDELNQLTQFRHEAEQYIKISGCNR